MPGVHGISVYDRLAWPLRVIGDCLASGAHRRELLAMFGPAEYAQLVPLALAAREAQARRERAARRVYVLPGIMGSQLGRTRGGADPPDLLWIDPEDIVAGELARLRLPEQSLRPLGLVPYTYLRLVLHLQAAGLDVRPWDYDWRQDITVTGAALAAELMQERRAHVTLVAHSLGGLVARAAMRGAATARVEQLIQLGTPNLGSYAAVQALRGSYAVVRRLAALDRQHDAPALAQQIFATFASLYQLCPAAALAAPWPQAGVQAEAGLHAAARGLADQLAPLDARCQAIVGIDQPTVVGLRATPEQFHYRVTLDGDGTVATDSAAPTGLNCHYLDCEHGELPRDPRVARAVIELLQSGRAASLGGQRPPAGSGAIDIDDHTLAQAYPARVQWYALRPEERGDYFNRLNLAPPQYQALKRP